MLLGSLKRIWFASDQLCGKRLKAAIPLWLPHYEEQYGPLADSVRTDLLTVSAATLDRLLKPLRVRHPKGLSGSHHVFAIAMTLLAIEIKIPGHEQVAAEVVAHALAALWPSYLAFLTSFFTILVIWIPLTILCAVAYRR